MHIAPKTVQEQELLRLLLTGNTIKECSVQLGRSTWTVRRWAADPAFLSALKELSAEIFERVDRELKSSKELLRAKLEEASEAALERIMELSQQRENAHIALKASQDLLDRDGTLVRETKVRTDGNINHTLTLDPVTLVHVAAAAREMDGWEEKKKLKE